MASRGPFHDYIAGIPEVFKKSPLHEAAQFGDLKSVLRLLTEEASVDLVDEKRRTPLHLAALGAYQAFLDEKSALEEGSLHPTIAIIQSLLAKGADINAVAESGGETPLFLALKTCLALKPYPAYYSLALEIVKVLLDAPNIKKVRRVIDTAMIIGAECPEVLSLILTKKWDVEKPPVGFGARASLARDSAELFTPLFETVDEASTSYESASSSEPCIEYFGGGFPAGESRKRRNASASSGDGEGEGTHHRRKKFRGR